MRHNTGLYRFIMSCLGLTCGFGGWLRGPIVLVDHAAEHLPTLHRPVQRYEDLIVMIGWPLLAGLMGPVPVVVLFVGSQQRSQMGLVVDEHPIRALGPCCPYPALA